MSDRLKILLPLVVVVIGLLAAVVIIKSKPQVERQPATALPPLVRVMTVQSREVTLTVRSQGTVQPRIESMLVAQVAGRIDWISSAFAEGGFFSRDESLVRIDDRDYHLAVTQAESLVAQARVRLENEQAEADLARDEWAELGKGDASPLALREPQLAEAKAALTAAEASLAKARLELERTDIRAPFDGRIRTKLVDLGQYINRGASLASVYSTDSAEVRLPIAQDQIAFLELGNDLRIERHNPGGPPVILKGDIGSETLTWTGSVVRTGSEFDSRTRMLPLFARVDDPFQRAAGASGPSLPIGLYVEAEIGGRTYADVVAIPRSALRGTDEVLIVDPEGSLRFRRVQVLRAERDEVLISDGLADGDIVCISPLEAVTDGMRVRTLEDQGPLESEDREEKVL